MPNYWPQQQQWPGSSSCSVRECCRSVAASGNVAGAGSGALQRTWERCRSVAAARKQQLQRPGARYVWSIQLGFCQVDLLGDHLVIPAPAMLLCAATLPDAPVRCNAPDPAPATFQDAATLLILPLQRSRTLQRSCNTPGRCNCCFLATAAAQASNLAFWQVVQERDTSGQFN